MRQTSCIPLTQPVKATPHSRSHAAQRGAGQFLHRVARLGAAALCLTGSFAAATASAQAATHYWAKVSAAGIKLNGSGVSRVVHFGNGRYYLVFSNSISACALIGTVNTVTEKTGYDPGPGSGSILVGELTSTSLFVRTATPSAAPGSSQTVDDDRPFSVTLTCP